MIKKAKKTNSKIISQIQTGILVLENKKVFKGIGIGYQGSATGEVCFNTSLTGYQEIISDPSYAGQIINFTFPHIGNVGTNKEDHESDKIWTKGVLFYSEITSHLVARRRWCFWWWISRCGRWCRGWWGRRWAAGVGAVRGVEGANVWAGQRAHRPV